MRFSLTVLLLLVPVTAFAQDEKPADIENVHDHPAVKRWPGSVITVANYREFEEYKFPIRDGETRIVEGKYSFIQYQTLPGASCTQITRNYENALKAQGLALHKGLDAPADDVGWGDGKWVSGEGKNQAGGRIFITVGCSGENADGIAFYLWVLEQQEMDQKVEINADAMADEISKTGIIALHGITFTTGKAEITPESGKTLDEIAALLNKMTDWKLRVEGHTDNVGQAAANLDLSRKRAEAVKAWLTGKLGIDPSRLSADGFGDQKPVAPNTTDEGRAKNRRVELRKF
ncbi:MAG: OmpA family protein [Vicinamibacteria bacterium]|nr:OmpA family protein [Vicinamibacteria bacterium]